MELGILLALADILKKIFWYLLRRRNLQRSEIVIRERVSNAVSSVGGVLQIPEIKVKLGYEGDVKEIVEDRSTYFQPCPKSSEEYKAS